MKKSLLLCFIILFVFPFSGESLSFMAPERDILRIIRLMGSLSHPTARSVSPVSSCPVQAAVSPSDLNVTFLCNVGNISVTVYSESGDIIYEKDVNTSNERALSIDVSEWERGKYKICFAQTGGLLYGTFYLDENTLPTLQ